jgi:ATP-dependent 26S proteasome regulatory subunit
MENIEQQPRRRNDHIKGSHADICLVNPPEWKEFFAQSEGHLAIPISNKSRLPMPIDTTEITYHSSALESDDTNTYELMASINFNPALITPERNHPWQIKIIEQLRDVLDENDIANYNLPHEFGSVYAHIAPEYFAHVTTQTTKERCIVQVALEPISQFSDVYEIDKTDPILKESYTRYDTFKSCLGVLSHIIDVVADNYGVSRNDTARKKHKIILDAGEALSLVGQPVAQQAVSPNTEAILNNADADKVIHFDDVAGYDSIKEKLLQLALQQKHQEFAHHNLDLSRTQGILLYGTPGTAKTMLLKAFANQIGAELLSVSATDIIEKWVGASARNLDAFFQELVQKPGKIVVLMDEFDSIGVAANEASSSERVDTVNSLKEWVIRIVEQHHNIILTAATNNIDLVDPALIRPGRFLDIEVPEPDMQMRREIWGLMLSKIALKAIHLKELDPNASILPIDYDSIDTNELAEVTEGMVGAHFTSILDAIKRQRLQTYDRFGVVRPITQEDILDQIREIKNQN